MSLLFNILMKVLLVFLLVHPMVMPELPQYAGKAMGSRAFTYPIAALVVPLIWLLRGRRGPYPHLLDGLVVLPFVVDLGGNTLNLYNTTESFDRVAHWFNWVVLSAAFGAAVSRYRITKINAFMLAAGFGAITHILWEISEYLVMISGAFHMQLTYVDTVEDLILSLLGSFMGAALTVTVFWKAKLLPRADQSSSASA